MQLVYGDLWGEVGKADLILVTTNSYLNKRGDLVTGRGAAWEAALRYPLLPALLGEQVFSACGHLGEYNVLFVKRGALRSFSDIGTFQVKYHYRHDADPELIGRSVDALLVHIDCPRLTRVAMNYPGVGNGHLDAVQVAPVIAGLPDNVWVYRKLSEYP